MSGIPPRAEDLFNWRRIDYAPVLMARSMRLDYLRKTPEVLGGLHLHYRDNPADFINDWGMTVDPRNSELDRDVVMPFLLFPKQREFIDWLHARWKGREDGIAEKSRDMGISWLCVAFGVWMWIYHPGSVVGFGSRKEEYVDNLGDPKSLFWKVRQFISMLPFEFRPKGYSEKKHAPFMRITNPQLGSVIVGEAGDNIGRGNRTSIYFIDEAAFLERPDAIDAALSQTSNCKISVSTPNGPGNPFARKRHSRKYPVFTFNWRDDPRKDQAWYDEQCRKLDPVIVAQEIDINYAASLNNAYIQGQLVARAMSIGPADIVPVGKWVVAVDAAHFGDDVSVIHCRKGRLNLPQIERRQLDGVGLASLVLAVIKELESFGDLVYCIVIELDGPGVSAYDQLRQTKYADRVYGVHTGQKLADDKHYNLRARMWSDARDYLRDEPVSLSPSVDLQSQLCAMKYSYKDGMLLMQSKKEYKKENGRSPDNADAFVLTFAAPEAGAMGGGSFEPGAARSASGPLGTATYGSFE